MRPKSQIMQEGMVFKFKVVDDLGQLAELWPRTDRCGSSSHCYVLQCADILEVWCDTVGEPGEHERSSSASSTTLEDRFSFYRWV